MHFQLHITFEESKWSFRSQTRHPIPPPLEAPILNFLNLPASNSRTLLVRMSLRHLWQGAATWAIEGKQWESAYQLWTTYPIGRVGHGGTDSGRLDLLAHPGLDYDLRRLQDESANVLFELFLVLSHCSSCKGGCSMSSGILGIRIQVECH